MVERPGFVVAVARGAKDAQCLGEGVVRAGQVSGQATDESQLGQRVGFAVAVSGRAECGQGSGEGIVGPREIAGEASDDAEFGEGVGFAVAVSGGARDRSTPAPVRSPI